MAMFNLTHQSIGYGRSITWVNLKHWEVSANHGLTQLSVKLVLRKDRMVKDWGQEWVPGW